MRGAASVSSYGQSEEGGSRSLGLNLSFDAGPKLEKLPADCYAVVRELAGFQNHRWGSLMSSSLRAGVSLKAGARLSQRPTGIYLIFG